MQTRIAFVRISEIILSEVLCSNFSKCHDVVAAEKLSSQSHKDMS